MTPVLGPSVADLAQLCRTPLWPRGVRSTRRRYRRPQSPCGQVSLPALAPGAVTLGRPSLAGGSLVVSRSVSAVVVAAAASAPRTDAVAALDARDLEILELLVDGLPTSQVAARLYLAPKTIRNRISEMLGKLGVSSRDDAVALGRAAGLGRGRGRP